MKNKLDLLHVCAESAAMAEERRVADMLWPRSATWVLIGVVLGTTLTVAATVNDIF